MSQTITSTETQTGAASAPSLGSAPSHPWIELACYSLAVVAWATLISLSRGGLTLPLSVQVLLVAAGLGLPVAGILLDPQRRAIAGRELLSYFLSPIAYVVLAVFTALASLFFVMNVLIQGRPIETGSGLFEPMVLWALIPITPAISMRLFAEELRSGNLESLVTAPLTDAQLVLGKWLGAVGFLAATLTASFLLIVLLELFGTPDYGPIFTGYIGMILLGGLFLAIGTFTSVMTRNQIIAFLVALIIIAVLIYVNLVVTNFYLSGRIAEATRFINPYEHYRDFARGIMDTGDFVFLISATAVFLVFAVKALESRKWR